MSKSPPARRSFLECVYPVYGSIIDFASENTILVDPAGRAFKRGETRYTGGGMSGGIYGAFDLTGKQHGIGEIPAGHAVLNRGKFDGIRAILHAVGPDGQRSGTSRNKYFELLQTTLLAVHEALVAGRVPKKCPIGLPFISASSYSHPDVDFFEYMTVYLQAIELIFGDSGYKIHLQLYDRKEQQTYAAAMAMLQQRL